MKNFFSKNFITVVATRSSAREVRNSINAKAGKMVVKAPEKVMPGVWGLSLSHNDGKGTLSLNKAK